VANWSVLTSRAVAAVHRPRPGRAAPRLAAGPGSTERSAYGIVTGLTEPATWRSRKDGRRNHYQIQAHLPLPEPASQAPAVGGVLALLAGAGAETAADRDRTGLASAHESCIRAAGQSLLTEADAQIRALAAGRSMAQQIGGTVI